MILVASSLDQEVQETRRLLKYAGFERTLGESNLDRLHEKIQKESVSVLLLELAPAPITANPLLRDIISAYPRLPVILVTPPEDMQAVEACHGEGVFIHVAKPLDPARLGAVAEKAMAQGKRKRLATQVGRGNGPNTPLRRTTISEAFAPILTQSPRMVGLFRYLEAVAPSPQAVLLTGETGVGKELFARAIHRLSRSEAPFVAQNLAGLDETLFSSELFGHAKGAFTGAERERIGLVGQAGKGVLFMDEVGDLAPASQVKLLRLIQEGVYYPVGSDEPRQCHARIVAATHQPLAQRIAEGSFRSDLFYRLSGHHVKIPPLRERVEDLPLLVKEFLRQSAESLGKRPPTPPEELFVLLALYPFPGNIRELQSMIQDAVARHSPGSKLSLKSFKEVVGKFLLDSQETSAALTPTENPNEELRLGFSHFPSLEEVTEVMIGKALRRTKGNQGLAATLLGISRQTLNRRLRGNRS